jgi:hypothetical protein
VISSHYKEVDMMQLDGYKSIGVQRW